LWADFVEEQFMADERNVRNRVRARRLARGWSQEELAAQAGISRTGISAIETGRLVPSAVAVLSLARAFECQVEELFSLGTLGSDGGNWAWSPRGEPCRWWHASVAGRTLVYPSETTCMPRPHDGVFHDGLFERRSNVAPSEVLVIASCDPALCILISEYERQSGFHAIALQRSSGEALSLLARGLIHVAGVHLEERGHDGCNSAAAARALDDSFCLLRTAFWQEGLAVAPSRRVGSVQQAIEGRLNWVGREPGSAAGELLAKLLGNRAAKHIARSHRGVAEAVCGGWADVGICVRLVSDDAGLDFLAVREEAYDLCFTSAASVDPRLRALVQTVRSPEYRRLIEDLPGYDVSEIGALATAGQRQPRQI
jgi:molybdate-binding protein/DNA-binding XRE family transcriptional regulator